MTFGVAALKPVRYIKCERCQELFPSNRFRNQATPRLCIHCEEHAWDAEREANIDRGYN
jgi:formylmethanofuran dehydrogenase subunit E